MWKKLYTGEKGGNSCKCWQPHRSVAKKKIVLKDKHSNFRNAVTVVYAICCKSCIFRKKTDIKVAQTNSPCGSFVVRTSCFRNLKSLKLKGWRVRALPKETLAKTDKRLNLALKGFASHGVTSATLAPQFQKGFRGRACGLHASGYPQGHPRWVYRQRAQTSVLSLLRHYTTQAGANSPRDHCVVLVISNSTFMFL